MVSPYLPPGLRSRAEWIGLGFAILCFFPAFFPRAFSAVLPNGLSGLVVPIVVASVLAGTFAALGADAKDAPGMIGLVPRLGIRAALITTLLGSGLTVFATTLQTFGSLIGSFIQGRVILTTLLGIPPSLFFGMLAAVFVAMITTPRAEQFQEPSANSTSKCNTLQVAPRRAFPFQRKPQATVVMGFALKRKCPNPWESLVCNA